MVFFLFINILHSQNDNKEKDTSLLDSIINNYDQQNGLKWLSLLPSVNYDFMNNSFMVGLNVNNLSGYFQQRQRNKIERLKLIQQIKDAETRRSEFLEKKDSDLQNTIKSRILDFDIEYESIVIDTSTLSINKSLFQIIVGKYQNKEIDTEEFLKEKISILKVYKSLLKSCFTLLKKSHEIEALSGQTEYKNKIEELTQSLTQEEKNLQRFGNGEFPSTVPSKKNK